MNYERKYIKHFFVVFLITFSILLICSLLWNIKEEIDSVEEYASKEAHGDFNKDLLFRRWASEHGGVYVPITDANPPNPHLEFLPHRDIVSETGMKLTLVNPAYMTRQVHDIAKKQYGVKGHITSLNPIRPENKADEWETKVLRSFENGETEATIIEIIDGEKYLRLMHPMTVEQSCMKCHAHQGYKVGDIRGGISVSVPMDEYFITANVKIKYLILTHVITFLLIIIIGRFSYKRIITEIVKRNLMQKKIVESDADLRKQNNEFSTLNKDYIKLNNKLTKALEKATESDRLKSAFLANMSHEIRTPMNGILGFANLLKKPNLKNEEQNQYVNIILKSGDRMLNTINDIIDISKIESGEMIVYNSDVNINNTLDDLYDFFKEEAKKKSITLGLFKALADSEVGLNTDSDKFYAVLSNLLKNALKYTDSGSVEFGYRLNNSKRELEFYVKDTGIGIENDKQKIIFERFIQADIEDKMALQGAGLGLAISNAYVEILGGKIGVESEFGKGSTFSFTLPFQFKTAKENTSAIEKTSGLEENKNSKILIVEDDDYSNDLLTITLQPYITNIINVKTGKKAIESIWNNPKIKLILMDIQMAEMNGYEATRKIRAFNKDVIIIAQTAFALIGDREKAIEAGCNDYISKPYNNEELVSLIQKHMVITKYEK